MSASVIKQLMISQIKSNKLPIGARLIWGDLPYGVYVNVDGSISKNKKSSYGHEEGTLEDLSLVELGMILEVQEKVTPEFYIEKTD